jgi:type III pantothenate kinase
VEAKRPEAVVGRDTEGSILSGVVYGTAGAVERIIEEAEGSMAPAKGPQPRAYRVAATGGCLEYLRPYLRRVDYVEPDLALKGLKIIYRRTRDA